MPFEKRFSLCLLKKEEVAAYLDDLRYEHPEIQSSIEAPLQVVLRSDRPLDRAAAALEAKFPTYVFHEETIAHAVHGALIKAEKKLALAESCTGGAIGARLVEIPGASYFLLGSLVVYSNAWKEKFLHVAPAAIAKYGAVSREVVDEMAQGLFTATDADYVVAVSGSLEPSPGKIYIAIAKRGERADIGSIQAPAERLQGIDLAVDTSLGALWRRIVHHTPTFS